MRKKERKPPKPVKYRRITWTDRLTIERLFNNGHSRHFIAREMHRSVFSISDEIKHGLYNHRDGATWKDVEKYSAQIAQDYADWQATIKGIPVKLDTRYDYADYVSNQIKQGISPDQITGRLRKEGKWTVSTPTLYRYIDKGYIPDISNKNLREKPNKKRKYRHVKAKRPPKGTSIEKRPEEINSRTTFGHWELDGVIGKAKGKHESVLVLTERLTRYEIILRVLSKTAQATVEALRQTLTQFPKGTFQTITVDNGSEFSDCEGMEQDADGNKRLTVYYCHPYSSCERGSNERNNRIIRRFFHKGHSFRNITQADCDFVADQINNMPRKILDYSTAQELFNQELSKLMA